MQTRESFQITAQLNVSTSIDFFFPFKAVDSEVELKFKIYQCHMKLREFRDAISIVSVFEIILYASKTLVKLSLCKVYRNKAIRRR